MFKITAFFNLVTANWNKYCIIKVNVTSLFLGGGGGEKDPSVPPLYMKACSG